MIDSSAPVTCADPVLDATEVRNGRFVLAPNTALGTVSRICDGGEPRRWQQLAPLTAAAYYKPFVTTPETGYADRQLDTTGLVAYWSFDGSGVVADTTPIDGFGASVTTVNPDNAGLAYTTGRIGDSLHFDGVDSYLKGTLPAIAPTPFTLSAWIWLDEVATENHIIAPGNVQFFVDSNRLLEFGDGVTEYDINGPDAMVPSHWYHVAVVQDASGWTLYQDGRVEVSGPQLTASAGTSLLIGEIIAEQQPDYYAMNGRIDEAVILQRALPASEIAALYERAALIIQYEVRGCDSLPCTGSFVGPFSEARNHEGTPAVFDLTQLAETRYLEWRATLETVDFTRSPTLLDVTVTAN